MDFFFTCCLNKLCYMLVSSAAFWLVTRFCCCIPVCVEYSHSWTFLGRGRDYTTRMSYAALLLRVRQSYRVQGFISQNGDSGQTYSMPEAMPGTCKGPGRAKGTEIQWTEMGGLLYQPWSSALGLSLHMWSCSNVVSPSHYKFCVHVKKASEWSSRG